MFSFYWQSNRKTLRNSGHIEQHIRLRKTTVCRNRILFRPTELQKQKDSETTVLAVGDERLNHIRNILKLLPGDKFKAGVLYGPRTTATVGDTLPSGETTIHFPNDAKETPLPRAPVEILLALPRPKVMNRLWPVLSSFGVQAVYITGAKKVERSYWGAKCMEAEKVEEQLLKGAEQAGDTILPRVVICQRLGQMLDWLDDTADARDFRGGTADGDAVFSPREIISGRGSESNFPAVCSESALPAEKQLRVVAHPVGCRASMASMLTGEEGGAKSPQQAPIMVAVGPEGGWTEEELTLLGTRGFTAFSLGERTLTTTEACIALLALAVDAVSSRPPKEYRQ